MKKRFLSCLLVMALLCGGIAATAAAAPIVNTMAAEVDPPTIGSNVYTGMTGLWGLCDPGAEVAVTIGSETFTASLTGSVWRAGVSPLKAGETISVVQTVGGVPSEPVTKEPTPVEFELRTLYTDDRDITGTANVGNAYIRMYIGPSYEEQYTNAGVVQNGRFILSFDAAPLDLEAMYNAGHGLKLQVEYQSQAIEEKIIFIQKKGSEDLDPPTLDSLYVGMDVIGGNAEPGSTVTATVGGATYTADRYGSYWEVVLPSALVEGDTVTAMQEMGGATSEKASGTPVLVWVTANPMYEGERQIHGHCNGEDNMKIDVFVGPSYEEELTNSGVVQNGEFRVTTDKSFKEGDTLKLVAVYGQYRLAETIVTVGKDSGPEPVAPPVIATPAVGDEAVTGTGVAGAALTLTIGDGGAPYTATVAADDTWRVVVSALQAGDMITAVQRVGEVNSQPVTVVVEGDDPAPVAAPKIATPAVGDEAVTGTGVAGAALTLTIGDGGAPYTATVAADGIWRVVVSALRAGDMITAVQRVGEVNSQPVTVVVEGGGDPEPNALAIGPIYEGDRVLSGSSIHEGATVRAFATSGSGLARRARSLAEPPLAGTATVQGGRWSIALSQPYQEGDTFLVEVVDADGGYLAHGNTVVRPVEEEPAPAPKEERSTEPAAYPYGGGAITGSNVNGRAAASMSAKVLRQFQKGTPVEIVAWGFKGEDGSGPWAKITYNGHVYFVYNDYVDGTPR